jgi:magnesium-transporting ATPase (P-type)
VAKLKESLQSMATVNRDGKFVVMPALNLVPGDLVILAAGSSVPADCRVNPQGKPHQNLIDIDESCVFFFSFFLFFFFVSAISSLISHICCV